MLVKFLVCVLAGLGAGIGTGLAGLSAAAVISPMLVTFLGFPSYQAVAISLASDVLASAVSARFMPEAIMRRASRNNRVSPPPVMSSAACSR